MAKKSGLGQRFYVDGIDISGDVGSIQRAASPRAALEVTGIDKDAVERILGLADGEIAFNNWFNPETSPAAEHEALSSLPTADRHVMYITGVTRGDVVACLVAKQVNYDWTRGQDGAFTGSVQCLAAAGFPLEWCNLLAAKKTHASATDETGIDHGSQTTNGGVGYLQHFDADSGTVEYDIEDSSDSTDGVDGTWANLLAFEDVATPYSPAGQRVAVAGTVERWVRASTNGTFTNAEFAMAFRRRAANDSI